MTDLSNDPEQLKAREDARVKKWIAQEAEAKMQSLSESRERSAAQALVHKAFWEAVAKATPDEADDILTCGEENEKSERRPPLQSGREH